MDHSLHISTTTCGSPILWCPRTDKRMRIDMICNEMEMNMENNKENLEMIEKNTKIMARNANAIKISSITPKDSRNHYPHSYSDNCNNNEDEDDNVNNEDDERQETERKINTRIPKEKENENTDKIGMQTPARTKSQRKEIDESLKWVDNLLAEHSYEKWEYSNESRLWISDGSFVNWKIEPVEL